uniref:Uncharacterized protein n=1 Tax=viral metagenome TaxID=1070528 RepID=A0A6M3X457_9ZZZZ
MTGTTMYVVTIDGRKHTLRNWQEVTHLCAKSFVSDPDKSVEIRHVAQLSSRDPLAVACAGG